jgi:Na+-driven multidrug efflux pump
LKDAQSPLRIITTAAVVNGISDLALVGLPMAWLGGAAGASWATILAQYTAAGMFLRWLFKKDPIGGKNSISSPTKGLLSSVSLRKAIRQVLPPKSIMAGYRPFVLPVTMSTVSRCAVYICMGHVVSSSLGTSSMAAQQIITSVFYSLIPIADSLSLTAQSFIPPILKDDKVASSEKAKVMRKTIFNLAKAAGVFGVFLASVVATLPVAVRVFTADTSVISLVNSIVPILFSVAIFHGVFCGSEGILLAQKDLGFLGRMYGLYFCIVPVLMLSIKRAASQGMPVELRSVWTLFLQYQAFRISVLVSRVLWLQSRISKPNEKAEDQQFLKLSIRDRILSSWLARKRPQRVRPG